MKQSYDTLLQKFLKSETFQRLQVDPFNLSEAEKELFQEIIIAGSKFQLIQEDGAVHEIIRSLNFLHGVRLRSLYVHF